MKRKTRGPARGVKLINLEKGKKLAVEFDKDHEVVGENSIDFFWFLGQIVGNPTCCPLQVEDWKKIHKDKINLMWDIILVR